MGWASQGDECWDFTWPLPSQNTGKPLTIAHQCLILACWVQMYNSSFLPTNGQSPLGWQEMVTTTQEKLALADSPFLPLGDISAIFGICMPSSPTPPNTVVSVHYGIGY